MKQYGINPIPECPLFSEFVADFSALDQVQLPSSQTVLLIVADASGIPADVIARVAERLLASGLIWVCVWGPDCQRVHDHFDLVHVGDGATEPSFSLMSTWHEDETLEDAIWFFTQCAFPLDHEIPTTSYLAVTVGNPEWAETVDRCLSDLSAFKTKMLDEKTVHTLP